MLGRGAGRAAHALGRGDPRAPDCLRQPRQHAAGARRRSAAGAGRAPGHRRARAGAWPPARDREPRAGAPWRGARRRARGVLAVPARCRSWSSACRALRTWPSIGGSSRFTIAAWRWPPACSSASRRRCAVRRIDVDGTLRVGTRGSTDRQDRHAQRAGRRAGRRRPRAAERRGAAAASFLIDVAATRPGFGRRISWPSRVALPGERYRDEAQIQFTRRLLERLRGLPGVDRGRAAHAAAARPGNEIDIGFNIDERPAAAERAAATPTSRL